LANAAADVRVVLSREVGGEARPEGQGHCRTAAGPRIMSNEFRRL